jgi:hypothetical protein
MKMKSQSSIDLSYPSISKINEKILLGNEDAARDNNLLKANGITSILICGFFIPIYHPTEFIY